MLSIAENKHYSRHVLLPEVGISGQLKLKKSSVLIIGAGGLGCPVLQYLTAAGIGTIGIVDFDKVEESNLQRQILYSIDDIGQSKVDSAIQRLSRLNPFVRFVAHNLQLTNQNAIDVLKDYDIIVDGTDNFTTRYLVNDACILLNKPLIYGSVYKFEGQVSVFNYHHANEDPGPTYRCLFPEPPSAEVSQNCSELGVLGILPGLIGIMQANEVIKIITGIGEVLSGRLYTINALTMQFYVINLCRNKSLSGSMPSDVIQYKKTDYDSFCNSKAILINEISSNELSNLLENNRSSVQIVDVREYNEKPELKNLKELQIPLTEIHEKVSHISPDKKVILICKSGFRSSKAIQLLSGKIDKDKLFSLKGGVIEWSSKYEL